MSSSDIRLIGKSLPAYDQDDYRYFIDNVYRGDFDDSESAVLTAFYRWVGNGAIRRRNASTDKLKLFVDVPFPKKNDFKLRFKGLWDPDHKCWYVIVTISNLQTIKNLLADLGFQPILLMDSKVQAVYNLQLAKSKFSADLGNPNARTNSVYTG